MCGSREKNLIKKASSLMEELLPVRVDCSNLLADLDGTMALMEIMKRYVEQLLPSMPTKVQKV